MFKRKVAILALVLAIGGSTATFAAPSNVGAGLGTMIMKGKSGKLNDIIALFLNGFAGNGFFAITFGTLGYQEGLKIGMAASDAFVAENMDALATDIAKGEGEYLDTLASIMKVEDRVAFKALLQMNFDTIYTSSDVTSEEVNSRIKTLLG